MLCDTTLTERYEFKDCKCDTYEGNLGPCETFEVGSNDRCVYCDHSKECHIALWNSNMINKNLAVKNNDKKCYCR